MRGRRLPCFTLIVCIMLPGSIVRAESASVRTVPTGRNQTRGTVKNNWRKCGQQVISAQRVREIQAALIRERYLNGRANGLWDQPSKAAMARFQSDNRWQSRAVPDSRALIKLGLGPDYRGLINPDTAAIDFIPGGGTRISDSPSQGYSSSTAAHARHLAELR